MRPENIFYIGIGSNSDDREKRLEAAGSFLKSLSPNHFRVSPVFVNPALLPSNAPPEWNIPFLNAVAELEWRSSPFELLTALKSYEFRQGRRVDAPRWSPRAIDLDILCSGDLAVIQDPKLTLSHPEATHRGFVLEPLKWLAPQIQITRELPNVHALALRLQDGRLPLWMGILNLTPDSFSDGGEISELSLLRSRLDALRAAGTHVIDIGGESTRPDATPVSPEEEWRRIEPALLTARELFGDRVFRPLVSVDTRNPSTAARALGLGVDWINDVEHLQNEEMVDIVAAHGCRVVLMHSLSVPVDRNMHLPEGCDPCDEILAWAEGSLSRLERRGVRLDRVIIDPGIGFGKTAAQSIHILKNIDRIASLGVFTLVGHSRKSFMNLWGRTNVKDRDAESIGLSIALASRGIDVIRVHNPEMHMRAWNAYREGCPR